MSADEIPRRLHGLLAAECAAEAADSGTEAADLRQAVRLRWLERARAGTPPPPAPAAWLRAAVRAEAGAARRRVGREVPWPPGVLPDPGRAAAGPVLAADGHQDPATAAEAPVLAAERRRALHSAVTRLPGRCPALLTALLAGGDRTYREIADALGIPPGSLGPLRSRCLDCLRRMLPAEVVQTATPPPRRGPR